MAKIYSDELEQCEHCNRFERDCGYLTVDDDGKDACQDCISSIKVQVVALIARCDNTR